MNNVQSGSQPDGTDPFSTSDLLGVRLVSNPRRATFEVWFVHGLVGNRERTWTHENGTFWPNLLAADFPSARIITYGYDISMIKFSKKWEGVVDNTGLQEYGEMLAAACRDIYEGHDRLSKLPVYFIAHSFGGLVVEQALLLGIGVDQDLDYTVDPAAGILFMGTPHRGSQLATWGYQMRKLTPPRIRAETRSGFKELKKDSNVCTVVENQFRTEAQHGKLKHIKQFSFYETIVMPGFAKLIVPKSSAVLPAEPSSPIHGTHISMVQFEGKLDPEYARVKNQLISWKLPVGRKVSGEGSVLILPVEKLQGQIEDVSPGISMLIAMDSETAATGTVLPGSLIEDEARRIVGPLTEFQILWRNRTGGVSFLQDPSRFLFQTPIDGGQFCSYAAHAIEEDDFSDSDDEQDNGDDPSGKQKRIRARKKSFKALLITDHHDKLDLEQSLPSIPEVLLSTDVPMAMLPCIFLRRHVEQTTGELKTLIDGVEEIEMTIKEKAEIKELHDQIRRLHACNTTLVKLERRWRFQTQLAESIHEFLDSHRESQNNRREMKINIGQMHGGTVSLFNSGDVEEEAFDRTHLQNHPDFKALGNNVGFHKRLIGGAEYDLEVLSRRISNLFTAIFNLIAQDDASATITLATSSLDDSSSMKTIAIMTLLFLPATFLSSFFSMSFFDWRSSVTEPVAKSLWVYFATAVPLTLVVTIGWAFLTRRSRDKVGVLLGRKKTEMSKV